MRGGILFVLFLLWRQESVRSIRLLELRVPAHAAAGGEALLGCHFDMENDLLYSVKWYKDGREFYRYMPRGATQTLRFLRPGVTVDMSRSSSDVVTLVGLSPQSAGIYRCEVSGEKPLFTTVADEKQITIHVLPKGSPKITGLRLRRPYEIGDRLIANCTTSGSRPVAQLKWLINNKPVTRGYLRGPWYRVVDNPPDDTTETVLGLNLMVLPSHFKNDVMEVKCQATIAPLYQRERSYILPMPEPTEKPEDLEPEPDPEPFDPPDMEIQQNIVDSFQQLANTLDALRSTTTEKPNELNKGFACITEKSLPAMLLALLVQVLLL